MWGLKLKWAYMLYENKDTQELFEYIVPFKQSLMKGLLHRGKRIWNCVMARKIPSRPEDVQLSAPPCMWCRYSHLCWNRAKERKWLKKLARRK